MPNHPSHDERQQELRRELRRRGLPPAYVERFISELDDHYANLVEQRRISMGAARKLQSIEDDQSELQQRIGEPTKLALFAAEQYRARSFWGMHAWVAYLVGPLPLYIAMWMLYLVSVWLPTYCIGTLGERMGWWTQSGMALAAANYLVTQAVVLTCFTWGLLVLPPIGAALVLCRVYRRNALDWRWPVIGCALLAIVVAAFHVSWTLQMGTGPTDHGLLMVGILPPFTPRLTLLFSMKFVLAMGIGLLLVKRAQQQMNAEPLAL